jgi:F420-dependent methylenetetrahydromethanopterin dehydrogenase
VAIPADRSVMQKEAEKQLKYNCLCIEIQMWNTKSMIILVLTGTTSIVTKGLRKYMEAISGNHSTNLPERQLHLEHHT